MTTLYNHWSITCKDFWIFWLELYTVTLKNWCLSNNWLLEFIFERVIIHVNKKFSWTLIWSGIHTKRIVIYTCTFTPVRDSINCSVIGEASDRDRALQRDDLHIRLAKAKWAVRTPTEERNWEGKINHKMCLKKKDFIKKNVYELNAVRYFF